MKNVILVVLDGYGIAPANPGNAITQANPTFLNSLVYSYPNTLLKASGEAVGLPAQEVGNTEVGHINIGAGKIVYQDLPRINMSIADGSFSKNEVLMGAVAHVQKTGGKLHYIGLVGEGAVHASIDHLYALLNFAHQMKISRLYLHAITDGRDSPPKSALDILSKIEEKMTSLAVGKIATVMGRYFAMDRDRRWERTEKAYNCLTQGVGSQAPSAKEAVETAYQQGQTDEFIEPTLIGPPGTPTALITEGDAVVFYNYRIDRPRQLTKAFVLDNFEEEANKSFTFDPYAVKYYKKHNPDQEIQSPPFTRGPKLKDLFFITMTEYEQNLPIEVAFPPSAVRMPISRVLAEQGLYQLKMSESEKERFVTFYFNGQKEEPFSHEDRMIIPSPKVATYDKKPEMAAFELTDTLLEKLKEQKYKFVLVNYANADMVGHTGDLKASMQAVLALDKCIQKLVTEALKLDYSVVITADHGNVEQKINPQTGQPSTEHTANHVPFIVVDKEFFGKGGRLESGILADVAPTILGLMDLHRPVDMTGRDLLEDLGL